LKFDTKSSFDELKEQWRKTAEATTDCWFGEVIAAGSKEMVSTLPKITRNGGTVTADPSHKIEIPAPNK